MDTGMLSHPAFLSPDSGRGEAEVKPEPLTVSGDEGGTVEEEEVPSPTQLQRGPSPEPKIEDTECHRSQSAMYVSYYLHIFFRNVGPENSLGAIIIIIIIH